MEAVLNVCEYYKLRSLVNHTRLVSNEVSNEFITRERPGKGIRGAIN